MFGCGTDEILHLINQVFLEPGDNIVQGEYGFGAYAIGARACQARGAQRRRAQLPHRRRRDAGAGRRAHAAGVRHQPGQPHRHLDHRGRAAPAARRACRPAWCWWWTRPTPSSATDPSFDDGLDLARDAPRTSSSPTPSPRSTAWRRCGSAGPTPRADRRRHRPHPPAVQHLDPGQEAAIAALGDEDFQAPLGGARRALAAWLTQQLGGLGLEVAPSGANFVLVELPDDARPDRAPRPRPSSPRAA